MPELFDILQVKITKVSGVTDIPDTWQPLASVSLTALEMGTYEYGLSISGSMGDRQESAHIRFSSDNGTNWVVFSREAKDLGDTLEWTYQYFKVGASGTLTMQIEAKKDTGGSQYDISYADVWIKRVA